MKFSGTPTSGIILAPTSNIRCSSVGLDIKLAYNIMGNIRLRGDYNLSDAENKNSAYKLYTNGIPDDIRIWDESRAVTNNLTGGLMIGITYTFTEY